jgi:hypothetical protein
MDGRSKVNGEPQSMKTLLLAILLCPTISFARLGETEQQLTARFGPPSSRSKELTLAQGRTIEFGTSLFYRPDDWIVSVVIVDGRSVQEYYVKKGDWSEEQFSTVLTSSSEGSSWKDVSKEVSRKSAREWQRADGAVAKWQLGQGMSVTNPAYVKAKAKAVDKAKEDAARIPKI